MKKLKKSRFAELVAQVQSCTLCPRMAGRRKVLSYANGSLDATVTFIAEAPGRLGADKFGVPLYGDQAGRNFELLIANAGLKRESIFITNAALCNPRTRSGLNDSPALSEIRNCSRYLKETLDILSPKYVVPLGTTALAALNIIMPHRISLSEGVGRAFAWGGYTVWPLYHPSPRALAWRTRAEQMEDYRALVNLLRGP